MTTPAIIRSHLNDGKTDLLHLMRKKSCLHSIKTRHQRRDAHQVTNERVPLSMINHRENFKMWREIVTCISWALLIHPPAGKNEST